MPGSPVTPGIWTSGDKRTLVYVGAQNTFVHGVVELAEECKVYIGGDDFKSGQTKMKSVMVDFLVSTVTQRGTRDARGKGMGGKGGRATVAP